MDQFFKYFLPAFLLLYFAVAFVLPSYRVWVRTGVNPITFSDSDNAHDYIGKLFKIVMLGLTLVVIIFPFCRIFILSCSRLIILKIKRFGSPVSPCFLFRSVGRLQRKSKWVIRGVSESMNRNKRSSFVAEYSGFRAIRFFSVCKLLFWDFF